MQQFTNNKLLLVVVTAIISIGATYFLAVNNYSPEVISNSPATSSVASSDSKTTTFNKSSKDYAIMGRQVWSGFQCAAWATTMEKESEAERLFNYGYEQGKTFIGALMADKIKQEDISSEVPIGVTWLFQGPSEEFILGRIYSAAEDDALEEVFKTGDEFNSDEMQTIIAGNKYRDGNCQLIGK